MPSEKYQHLGDEAARLKAANRYTYTVQESSQIYGDLAYLTAVALQAPIACISLITEIEQKYIACYGANFQTTVRRSGFCADAIKNPSELLIIEDVREHEVYKESPLSAHEPFIRAYAGACLTTPEGFAIGTLCVMDTQPRPFTDEQTDLLRLLARQVMSQLDLRKDRGALSDQNDKLQTLVTCDALTGLKNIRAFHERLDSEIIYAERHNSPLSIMLLDADKFKDYNDQFGHPNGDIVLQAISILLIESSRDYDFVARYGGEEFAIILRGADSAEAFAAAERLRSRIAGADWPHRRVTVSIGLATHAAETSSRASLILEADRQLYISKTGGRNRVSQGDAAGSVALPDV